MRSAALVLLLATAAHAQVVATVGRDIAVAHDLRVELFDATGRRIWTADGVDQPSRIATNNDRIAVIDSFANTAVVIDRSTGRMERMRTGETPVDAVFFGRDLYVLTRDASRLDVLGPRSLFLGFVQLAPDPAFLRAANGKLYVYSRLDGVVQEITPGTLRIGRTLTLAPFASDFEIDGRIGYLVYPADAKLRTFTLSTMKRGSDIGVGAVPVDLAVTARANALSASRLAIADPSAKRVWIAEGEQSVARAIARGFIRGLLGLGLFSPKSSDFPSGVDRVVTRGSTTVVYDSTTQTLYRVKGKNVQVVARDLPSGAFAVTDSGLVLWQNGALRLIH
ncbi:MAG TPA: hypothetical protein VGK31_11960 [Thermoanaerobaculia bacterium]